MWTVLETQHPAVGITGRGRKKFLRGIKERVAQESSLSRGLTLTTDSPTLWPVRRLKRYVQMHHRIVTS